MLPLRASDILTLWDLGSDRHPLDRALLILAVACPERSPQSLSALSIGQRDSLLMQVRQHSFGRQLHSRVPCPCCQEPLEFELDLAELPAQPSLEPATDVQAFTLEGWQVQFRRLNSVDLAAIVQQPTAVEAAKRLVQRCLLSVHFNGNAVEPPALPAAVVQALAAQMSSCETAGDITLDLVCPVCGHAWSTGLDILTFLWDELVADAKRLLLEVDALARTYGWREADILAMSNRRRQQYLALALES